MKKLVLNFNILGIIIFLTCSFTPFPIISENFVVDVQTSNIKWLAKKIGGQHNGIIKLSSGSLVLNQNNITEGTILINMPTMTCLDLEGDWNKKMIDHLKSEDFFFIQKYPTSKFQITKTQLVGTNQINVTGNLTIKGISQPLKFLADLKIKDNILEISAKNIKVDRTKYDIKYGSKSFFASIGDKAIEDEFEISFNLIARKEK